MIRTYFFCFFLLLNATAFNALGQIGFPGGGMQPPRIPVGSGQGDSLRSRYDHDAKDSISISYRFLTDPRGRKTDSILHNFDAYYPLAAQQFYLGNLGSATRSVFFNPNMQAGWQLGYHAMDVYGITLDSVRFYQTTQPLTQLTYILGKRAEQTVELLHTQNIKPNWNFAAKYRLINAPGVMKNLKSNHNNYLFNTQYTSKNKRFNLFGVVLGNRLNAGESGGLLTDRDYLNDATGAYDDRFNIPTNIGGDNPFDRNAFSRDIPTGSHLYNLQLFARSSYDIGQKDEMRINDSTVVPLFYPRIRFEYTVDYQNQQYFFEDRFTKDSAALANYKAWYGLDSLREQDTIIYRDKWRTLTNEVAIYTFPDAKNPQQFLRLFGGHQYLKAFVPSTVGSDYNIYAGAQYRNRTKNKKWDIDAMGKIWLAGLNGGDYVVDAKLKRLSAASGGLELQFQQANQSPAWVYTNETAFNLNTRSSFNKQNTTHFNAGWNWAKAKMQLNAHYYLISNYLYFKDYKTPDQFGTLFNVLKIEANKTFKLARHVNWYMQLVIQQRVGDGPVNLPLAYTRNIIAFEGRFFKNLNISTGFDTRYNTPFKADGYSPLMGQWFYQDSLTIANRPDVAAFVHFRINKFKAFVRAENLNTLRFSPNFGFLENNVPAPGYITPGFIFRLGIVWAFVN